MPPLLSIDFKARKELQRQMSAGEKVRNAIKDDFPEVYSATEGMKPDEIFQTAQGLHDISSRMSPRQFEEFISEPVGDIPSRTGPQGPFTPQIRQRRFQDLQAKGFDLPELTPGGRVEIRSRLPSVAEAENIFLKERGLDVQEELGTRELDIRESKQAFEEELKERKFTFEVGMAGEELSLNEKRLELANRELENSIARGAKQDELDERRTTVDEARLGIQRSQNKIDQIKIGFQTGIIDKPFFRRFTPADIEKGLTTLGEISKSGTPIAPQAKFKVGDERTIDGITYTRGKDGKWRTR